MEHGAIGVTVGLDGKWAFPYGSERGFTHGFKGWLWCFQPRAFALRTVFAFKLVAARHLLKQAAGSERDYNGVDEVVAVRPGRPLAAVPPAKRPGALLTDIGRVMGRTADALRGFDHPAAHRPFQWSAEEALEVIAAHAPAVTDPARAALLRAWQARLAPLAAILPDLRHGVIHNDANDHNVLVADDGRSVSGLLDLGDAIWSVVVHEVAVAAAYAALGAPDPLAVVRAVAAGFEEIVPLEWRERELLPELVALRLATSVALSAHQAGLAPDDPYLTVSEAPAWALLERLAREDGR